MGKRLLGRTRDDFPDLKKDPTGCGHELGCPVAAAGHQYGLGDTCLRTKPILWQKAESAWAPVTLLSHQINTPRACSPPRARAPVLQERTNPYF